jgi:hypothetical protein
MKEEIVKDLFMHFGFDRAALYKYVTAFMVSHMDRDHLTRTSEQWIPAIYRGNKKLKEIEGPLVLIPWKGYQRPQGDRRIKVKPLHLTDVVGHPNRLHCVWLLVEYWLGEQNVRGVLIGDLDIQDIEYLKDTVKDQEADFVVLPSYGGVTSHGSEYPTDLKKKVAEVAKDLRKEGIVVVARPHTIHAEWADINLELVVHMLS